MNVSEQSHFRAIKRSPFILSLLLALLVVCDAAGQVRRRIEISRFVQPSRVGSAVAGRYFTRAFRFAGGVVPRGTAVFINPAGRRLGTRQLELVILDKSKLRNNRTDYDAIGIRWNGKIYQLAAQDDLIYPLMKFIQRGSYIAFTIPVVDFDENYFRENSLLSDGGVGYVAKEFLTPSHIELLQEIDLDTETQEMLPKETAGIMRAINRGNRQSAEMGTYVNADFHIAYQVFLANANGKNVVDVGGLPLRYSWSVARDGRAVIDEVQVFTFPEDEFSLQDRAVMFFQTAAILRQFSQDNPREFNRFLREVGTVEGRR
jgi:hypothetical protein